MVRLTLHSNDENAASCDTRTVRRTHHEVCDWLCATQVWTFEGEDGEGCPTEGDAIVVPVNSAGQMPESRVVLRIGDVVHVLSGGVGPALEAFGFKIEVA